ncbi:MAG TPA: GNAT family N-acetyltransferase [Gemmatimonadaceae bacterium]|nr:GNAT family N-acetyltransferase [Gemmatimonadaceae bacterium]
MIIRGAIAPDAQVIAELLGELGYPATAEDVVARLERLAAFPSAVALVAEVDERVAGVITCHLLPSIHASAVVAWLTTLVVDSRSQSRGIGRTLVAAVESWARDAGAVRISVTSGSHRSGAHAFYERIGYDRSGVRLTKPLS